LSTSARSEFGMASCTGFSFALEEGTWPRAEIVTAQITDTMMIEMRNI
jgi:hypothetical protein